MSQNRTEVLAECDQTSCRSVKEGYQMIHDQYLKGDLSLTITAAGLSKRGWYTCNCDGTDLRDVELQVEPLITTAHMKTGESLLLKLDVPDPVEVLYNGTDPAGPSSVSICTVSRSSVECIDQYEQRVSFNSGLELRGVTPSDSGVYTIRNMDEEVLCTYTVTVQGMNTLTPHSPAQRKLWLQTSASYCWRFPHVLQQTFTRFRLSSVLYTSSYQV
ncbi:hypothetical protein NFI96_031304 [Prochilodus magdalenae]|nr:hypothetical protein NFI96_031304 [Prochilodus magdalenae]